MRDRQRARLLEQTQADLKVIIDRVDQAVRNLDAWRGRGYPASSLGGSIGGIGGDPVGRIVELDRPDRFESDRRHLDVDVGQLAETAAALRRLVIACTENVSPDKTPPGCRCCNEANRWMPIYAQERCDWHYRWWVRWGEDIHPELTKLHVDGRRISQRQIRAFHPQWEEGASA